MADDDFRKQLQYEELEKQRKELSSVGASDPYTHVDPNDGTVYEWDLDKKAWFPKVDDDFIAKYQSNYQYQGHEDDKVKDEAPAQSSAQPAKGEKRKPSDPCWFEVEEDKNTNVYVSGLPTDIKDEEFVELMSKCGLLMKDPDTMENKIKLYRNSDGTLKGDGRCCYIRIESVKLALDILDGYLFKGKHRVHVERAQFQLKGQYDPSKKPKKKKTKEKEKIKKKLEKLFDWRPDKLRGERSKNENTVIIKNMFDPKEFEDDAALLLDYQKDVREECSKCGDVKKVVIYDRNPQGVVAVTYTEPEMADACINLMNKRWFAARQLTAETWDGKTKYKIIETDKEKEQRLKGWEKFLETDESTSKDTSSSTPTQGIRETNPKSGLDVPSDVFDKAGSTDSSGDSDDDCVPAKDAYPVMQANGGFSFHVPKTS